MSEGRITERGSPSPFELARDGKLPQDMDASLNTTLSGVIHCRWCLRTEKTCTCVEFDSKDFEKRTPEKQKLEEIKSIVEHQLRQLEMLRGYMPQRNWDSRKYELNQILEICNA